MKSDYFWHTGQKNVDRAGLHDALDGAAAIRRRARLALAIVDAEIVLEICPSSPSVRR